MSKAGSKKSVLDALVGGGDSDDGSEEEDAGPSASKGEGEEEEEDKPASKKKALTLEDLQRAGLKEGPSVLLMRAPKDEGQTNWAW
jgi:hypothetical protein